MSINAINSVNIDKKPNSLNRTLHFGAGSSSTSERSKSSFQKVKAASIAGSAIGIASAVLCVYSACKKKNPSLLPYKMSYSEAGALCIGFGSVLGGLIGGLTADKDKKNIKPKLREASQQFVGNMVFPLGTLALGNKLLKKINIKMPQIKSATAFAKYANNFINVLPKAVMTVSALVLGMETGNKVINIVNNKLFKEEVKHDVKAEDYLVHADDICITANMLLKDVKSITSVTSTLLPLSFIVSGSKTGIQQAPDKKSDSVDYRNLNFSDTFKEFYKK